MAEPVFSEAEELKVKEIARLSILEAKEYLVCVEHCQRRQFKLWGALGVVSLIACFGAGIRIMDILLKHLP
jgi:hypothetical protein